MAHAVPDDDAHLDVRPTARLPFVGPVQPDQVVQRDYAGEPRRDHRTCVGGAVKDVEAAGQGERRERQELRRDVHARASRPHRELVPANGGGPVGATHVVRSLTGNEQVQLGVRLDRQDGPWEAARVATDAPGALAQEQQVESHPERAPGRVGGATHRRMRLEDGPRHRGW